MYYVVCVCDCICSHLTALSSRNVPLFKCLITPFKSLHHISLRAACHKAAAAAARVLVAKARPKSGQSVDL
jgi:hypothetical protein